MHEDHTQICNIRNEMRLLPGCTLYSALHSTLHTTPPSPLPALEQVVRTWSGLSSQDYLQGDATKAKNKLGWVPKVTFHVGQMHQQLPLCVCMHMCMCEVCVCVHACVCVCVCVQSRTIVLTHVQLSILTHTTQYTHSVCTHRHTRAHTVGILCCVGKYGQLDMCEHYGT